MPTGAKDSSLPQNVKISSGAHPTAYSMSSVNATRGGKAAGVG